MSNESSSQNHEMQLLETHSTGATEWFCPTCGRRLLMQFPPNYKKIVLNAGDEYAVHSGGTGGLRMGAFNVMPEDDHQEDKYLTLWDEWLNSIDFESLWGQDSP